MGRTRRKTRRIRKKGPRDVCTERVHKSGLRNDEREAEIREKREGAMRGSVERDVDMFCVLRVFVYVCPCL